MLCTNNNGDGHGMKMTVAGGDKYHRLPHQQTLGTAVQWKRLEAQKNDSDSTAWYFRVNGDVDPVPAVENTKNKY